MTSPIKRAYAPLPETGSHCTHTLVSRVHEGVGLDADEIAAGKKILSNWRRHNKITKVIGADGIEVEVRRRQVIAWNINPGLVAHLRLPASHRPSIPLPGHLTRILVQSAEGTYAGNLEKLGRDELLQLQKAARDHGDTVLAQRVGKALGPTPLEARSESLRRWVNAADAAAGKLARPFMRLFGFRRDEISGPLGTLRYYHCVGKNPRGPVVIVCHGITGSSPVYLPVGLPAKTHASRVIMVDLPGHGSSDVPRGGLTRNNFEDMLLPAADILLDGPLCRDKDLVFYGNSLGGQVIMSLLKQRLQARFVQRVRGVFLASPAGMWRLKHHDHFFSTFKVTSCAEEPYLAQRIFGPRLPLWMAAFVGIAVRAKLDTVRPLIESIKESDRFSYEDIRALSHSLPQKIVVYSNSDDTLFHRQHYSWKVGQKVELVQPPPGSGGHIPFAHWEGRAAHNKVWKAKLQSWAQPIRKRSASHDLPTPQTKLATT